MIERTRQTLLATFLAVVLVLTIGAACLFAAQQRAKVTALGQKVVATELGFAIQMPKGWVRMPEGRVWIPEVRVRMPDGRERIARRRWRLVNALLYRQPLKGAQYDSNTQRDKRRLIFLIAIPPNASAKQVVDPLDKSVIFWDINHNLFRDPKLDPFPLGRWRLDSLGYERRDGVITFLNVRFGARFVLMRYQQIRANGRVFWCVMAGSTQLTEADRALLQAVASSFRLLN